MEKKRGKIASLSSSPILVPQEIVFEILKELPVKTLVRFRAVCKLWCSIIDDPIFIDSHRTRSYTRTGGISILCQYRDNLKEYSLGDDHSFKIYSTDPEGGFPVPFLTIPLGVHGYRSDHHIRDHHISTLLQSVNGLVCRKHCLWNPSTRESIDLPPIRIDGNEEFRFVSQINLLGFDSVTKQYKVVNVRDIMFKETTRAEFRILTLGRDSHWRNLDYVPEKLGFKLGYGVCCIDGVIFYSARVDRTKVIVAFKVGAEKFRVISLPNKKRASYMSPIMQIGGRVGFINFDYARMGEVHVDPLTNVKVVKSLNYVLSRDVVQATNRDSDDGDDDAMTGVDIGYGDDNDADTEVVDVQVMTIWILEDYHKQQWKKETFTFPSAWKDKHYGRTNLFTTPMGSIHMSEILLCSNGRNLEHNENQRPICCCSYYDLESKSLRMVPKITEFPNDYQHAEDNRRDPIFFAFIKHVECLFKLSSLF